MPNRGRPRGEIGRAGRRTRDTRTLHARAQPSFAQDVPWPRPGPTEHEYVHAVSPVWPRVWPMAD
eukprot:108185-Prymnesium_polylepis.1